MEHCWFFLPFSTDRMPESVPILAPFGHFHRRNGSSEPGKFALKPAGLDPVAGRQNNVLTMQNFQNNNNSD